MRKFVLLIMAVLSVSAWALAQNRQISGTVTNADGRPIAGATVLVEGTSTGTVTNADGRFSVSAPANGTLAVSFIGYETVKVAIAGKTQVNVSLQEDTHAIDDVIVVAYGTATKASLTGSVASVKSADIEKRTTSSVTSTLEGASPGIQVNSSYGEPGSSPDIRIRGFGSINGSNDPLYVVDGTIFGGSISDLNPADIESVNVLKDAASASLYGNRAANGVILITTKRGQSNKLNVRLNTKQGVYTRGIAEYDRLGPDDWMETMFNVAYNDNYAFYLGQGAPANTAHESAISDAKSELIPYYIQRNIYDAADDAVFDDNGKVIANVLPGYDDLDWFDGVEQTGYRGEYNIQADVAGERYDVFASLSYLTEDGYIKNNNFERFTGRISANFKANKWFRTGLNLSGTSQYNDYQAQAYSSYYANPFYSARMMAPVYPMYLHNEDGSYALDENGNKQFDTTSPYLGNRNIAYELQNDYSRISVLSLNTQAYATFTFLKDFEFTVKGSMDRRNLAEKVYNNPNIGDGASNGGRLSKTFYQYKTYTFQQQLVYNKDFAGKHHIDVLLGHENYSYKYDYDFAMKANQGVAVDQFDAFTAMQYINGYVNNYTTESYLSRLRYNYDQRYFIEGSYRRDGSSRFAKDHRWGNFWSLGGSWVISNEQFMKQAAWVDFLKLRASYGEVGNDQGAGYYAYKNLYGFNQNAGELAIVANQFASPDLKWETTQSFDIGIDLRLWNRLDVTIDYFSKRSKDLLYNENLPQSAGPISTDDVNPYITRNFGSVKNYGVEIALNADLIRTKDWRWDFGVNATFLKNKIKELPRHEGYESGTQRLEEGHSIYEFYLYQYAGVDQLTGYAMYEVDADAYDPEALAASGAAELINGQYYTPITTYARKDWSGTALPTVYGGITTNLTWKNLTFSALCSYSLGGKVFDSTYRMLMYPYLNGPQALHPDILKSWRSAPEGMTADSPNRLDPNGIPMNDSSMATYTYASSDRWLTSASYFIVKNLGLTYTFPKQIVDKIGLGDLSVSFNVENPITCTSRRGLNPQYSFSGGQDQTYVSARIYTFGLNLKF